MTYEEAAINAATIAQKQYKNTKLEEPWPLWEEARTIAHQAFIDFLKQNENPPNTDS